MNTTSFEERVRLVRQRLQEACDRCGRHVNEVELVAVSKYHPASAVDEAVSCGLTLFGESRVQEALEKIPQCREGLQWQFIGHLQRNKARKAVELFDVIHSIDSLRLLSALDRSCEELGREISVYLEVNVSGEMAKFGIEPDALLGLLEEASSLKRVNLLGLMTMPPRSPDPEAARPHFAALRKLRDKAAEAGYPLEGLSMGMSHDFEVAIEEGCTSVRVGTAIFGEREY